MIIPTSAFKLPKECFPLVLTLLDMTTRDEVWRTEVPDPAPTIVAIPSIAECNRGRPVIVRVTTADGAEQQFPPVEWLV